MTIEIKITGETVAETLAHIRSFLQDDDVTIATTAPAEPEQEVLPPEPEAEEKAEEPKKKKRNRRTKAEIAADKMRAELKAQPDDRETCRYLASKINEEHGSEGLKKIHDAIKMLIGKQEDPFAQPKLSNVDEVNLPQLINILNDILSGEDG